MSTGDLIFFKQTDRWYLPDYLIRFFTHSPWVHVGMILKDPQFLGLKGTYIWESDPLGGVQIHPFTVNPRRTWIRKYRGGEGVPEEKLKEIHELVHGKPYDKNPIDWIEAAIGKDFTPQRTNSFWCSALVGCILTKMGVLDSKTDWSIMSPDHLANFYSKYYLPL